MGKVWWSQWYPILTYIGHSHLSSSLDIRTTIILFILVIIIIFVIIIIIIIIIILLNRW